MIEGQEGLTWERWRHICQDADELGFDSLRRSEHFISVFGVEGREVATLIDHQYRSAGHHELAFDLRGRRAGVYFYQLRIGRVASTRKVMFLR